MDMNQILSAAFAQIPGLETKSEEYIRGIRVLTLVLSDLYTKGRQSNNGQTSLFLRGGYVSNFMNNGEATSWPFMWFSDPNHGTSRSMTATKVVEMERVETQKGEKVIVTGTRKVKFQYFNEEKGELLPYNLKVQFTPKTLKGVLKGEEAQDLLSSPAGMTGAWHLLQEELLRRGTTVVHVVLTPEASSISTLKVGKYYNGSHDVATWELSSLDVAGILWASKGEVGFIPGLDLNDEIVDMSAWEEEVDSSTSSKVISVADVLPQDKKVTQTFNRKYGKWLKERDLLSKSFDLEVQDNFLSEYLPSTPFGKWLATPGKRFLAYQTLSTWEPKGAKSNNMAKGAVQKEPAKPEPEPKAEPKAEIEEVKTSTVKKAGGMGSMSRSSISSELSGDFED